MTFQKFFDNNYSSKFIKSLLRNIPLPKVPTISEGQYMIEGKFYLLNNTIVKCTTSGILATEHYDYYYSLNQGSISTYEIVSTYLFGDKDAELSDTFISENSYYDSETHKRLGEYLRCYRDLYGVDLMSMYNCFAYDILSGFYYNGEKIEKETNSSYKMVAIPIKFNRTYTVAIDCSTPYYIYPIFYGENGLTNIGISTNNNPLTDRVIEQHGDEFATKVKGSRFNHPYTFNVSYESQTFKNRETVESDLSKNYENNLYMVLQLPSTNDSSIVVLEGDYTEVPSQNLCNEIGSLPVATQNNLMLGQVGLLQFNSKTTYAFSNKLMEYLLDNVICPTDEISENIVRIQDKVGTLGEPFTVKGIYDPILRKRVYDKCIDAKDLRKYDINGYVDRDTEHYLFIREGGR